MNNLFTIESSISIPILFLVAFLFGVTNKIADLLDEHGLKIFKNADIFFGFIWGFLGLILVFSNDNVALNYLALIIYWFFMIKLEYYNHSLAGTIILFGALKKIEFNLEKYNLLLILFLANLITILMQRLIKKRYPLIARARIRIYLIPFLFSYYVGDFTTFWITVIAMIGVEITTNYAKYKLKIN